MSEVFHKSCYTSRSSGYKYRTLSTNTGESQVRRTNKDDSIIDKKFKELKREIIDRVNGQVESATKSRETIKGNFTQIVGKINSLLELKETMNCLQNDLQNAAVVVMELANRLDRVEEILDNSNSSKNSLNPKKSTRSKASPKVKE